MYQAIVGRGLMSPAYFFDHADVRECELILESISEQNRNSWEQTRYLMWMIAQVHSTTDLEPNDVLKFGWDDVDSIEETSKEDIENLKKTAKEYERYIN